jgi:hypothetical protein
MKEMRCDFNNLHDGIERCFLSAIDMAAGMHTMTALWSLVCMEAILLAFLSAFVCCLLSCCCFGYSHWVLGPLVDMHMEYTPREVQALFGIWYICICTR